MSENERPPAAVWQDRRRQVLERDDYTCQDCGVDVGRCNYPAEIHHKTPVEDGGSHEPTNLVTLCRGCHKDRHGAVTLDDVMTLFDEIDRPAIVSSDVADRFGVTTETGRQKLQRLVDRGVVNEDTIGRTNVYWPADGGVNE